MRVKEFLYRFSSAVICTVAYPVITALTFAIHLLFIPVKAVVQGLMLTAEICRGSPADPRVLLGVFIITSIGCLIVNLFLFVVENNPLQLLTAPFTGFTVGWQLGLKAIAAHNNFDFFNLFFGVVLGIILYPLLTIIHFILKLPLLAFTSLQESMHWLRGHQVNWLFTALVAPVAALFYFTYKIGEFVVTSLFPSPVVGGQEGFKQGLGGILHHPLPKGIYDYFNPGFPLPRFNAEREAAERAAHRQRNQRVYQQVAVMDPFRNNVLLPVNINALQQDRNYAASNNLLLDKIASLAEPPTTVKFLSEPELEQFKKLIADEKIGPTKTANQTKLDKYLLALEDNVCPITYNSLHELKEPITVKRDNWTHIYEQSALVTHIETENNNRRTHAKDVITRQRFSEPEISISKGLPAELTTDLQLFLKEVREALVAGKMNVGSNPATLFASPSKKSQSPSQQPIPATQLQPA